MDNYLSEILYNLTHKEDEASYCFIKDFTDIIGDYKDSDLNKVIELIQYYGYDVYSVGRQDELDDTLIIVDKNCDLNNIKDDFLTFFSVDIVLTKLNTKDKIKEKEE